MVNFQELQKWGFQIFTISDFQNGDYPKRRFPISFIGNGDFENVDILKEGKAFNLQMVNFQEFQNSIFRNGDFNISK